MNSHRHGLHDCRCSNDGYTQTVEEGVKCNTVSCAICGGKMRTVETGEFRPSQISQNAETPVWVPLLFIFGLIGFLSLFMVKTKGMD